MTVKPEDRSCLNCSKVILKPKTPERIACSDERAGVLHPVALRRDEEKCGDHGNWFVKK